ncbi:MAG: Gfo/Idh/MocA family protein [Hyphomicrobiales bacterium]
MGERRIGIIMNGATGRMGRNQHARLSIDAIRKDGGLELEDGTRLVPDPILVGRNAAKLQETGAALGIDKWSTDLDAVLSDPSYDIYFDAVPTTARAANLRRAVAAGKHVYTEKPTAESTSDAHAIYKAAAAGGIKHGVVHDKLWAPGMRRLRMLLRSGFFGRVLMVRIEGCYWVFEGDLQPAQRPSWNYRKEAGGGMILDMMPHYAYMLDAVDGPVTELACHGETLVDERIDEQGAPYKVTADDTFLAMCRLRGGAIAQIMSSWCTRIRTEDIIMMHVDGTHGSAVVGLRDCWIQRREATPRAQWSLDLAQPPDYYADWQKMPEVLPYKNAFRIQWEKFLRHVAEDAPFPWTLYEAAGGVQLAELCQDSWADRRWVNVPHLER